MMKKVNRGYFILALVLSTGAFAWAVNRHNIVVDQKPITKIVKRERVFSKDELINRLQKVFGILSMNEKEIFIQGEVAVKEIGDTLGLSSSSGSYILSRKNESFYYKMGDVEVFNTAKNCVMVDHTSKQIRITKSIPAPSLNMSVDVEKLPAHITSENYVLSSKINGSKQTISLINENHMSCKEYAITFDTLGYLPNRIFTRLTGNSEPQKSIGEKHIEVRITTVKQQSEIEKYLIKNAVQKVGGEWKKNPGFEAYQLIEK